jgi:hypothetical protein
MEDDDEKQHDKDVKDADALTEKMIALLNERQVDHAVAMMALTDLLITVLSNIQCKECRRWHARASTNWCQTSSTRRWKHQATRVQDHIISIEGAQAARARPSKPRNVPHGNGFRLFPQSS